MARPSTKRPAPTSKGPSKKRKLAPAGKSSERSKPVGGAFPKAPTKAKERAKDRSTIPVPAVQDEDADSALTDEDAEHFEDFGGAAAFLGHLDQTAVTRSKKETDRLHRLSKPTRQRRPADDDDLPSVDSHSGDEGSWDSVIDSDTPDLSDSLGGDGELSDTGSGGFSDSDAEMPYEAMPRKRRPSWDSEANPGIERLPIKLSDGRIQKSGAKIAISRRPALEDSGSEEEEEDTSEQQDAPIRDDVATGARFGRPAVVDVVGIKSRKARLQGAKEQIASICQEILADPENSLGLLRRLHTFSLPEIATPTHPEPVTNDEVIRRLAILSQLAIFKDILPGYRIRPLTDKEKAEKVSQMVARTRDWEQGLVGVYQVFLRSLEQELKGKSALADIALMCMCTLLVEATHFNFRVNLMSTVVARLSKKSWDKSSDLCLETLIKVFRADLGGEPSLEAVRLLNRMVKERKFNIHPEVLSCLLHLRLKAELGVRSSDSRADKAETRSAKPHSKGKAAARRAKGKAADVPHLSKKVKMHLKDKKEIEKEMHEAEAEVDQDERTSTQTETLKLLFVLYFRILKNPEPTPLLSAALRGIARYAHLVNIDFFKDLMKVLKDLIARAPDEDAEAEADEEAPRGASGDVRYRLECIVTAFELLTGQGEALNLDLSEFISQLYVIILPLSLASDIEAAPGPSSTAAAATTTTTSAGAPGSRAARAPSTADLLFRALTLVFSPRSLGASAPPWRSAAFAKRLLGAALHWPPATALRALDFVGGLVAKDPKLEALLATDDRAANGVYRAEIDDPQLSHAFGSAFWELFALLRDHWDARVRAEAGKLLEATRH